MHLVKGGMCSNPFGGRVRLDRIDLMSFLDTKAPQEKIIFLQTITDAVHNYLFFGLGKNGTTAEEFAYACEYLFKIRSGEPKTWEHARSIRLQIDDPISGKRQFKTVDLTDNQLCDMCFDTHFEYSGLSMHMPLDRFLSWLKTERMKILRENQEQVYAFVNALYDDACRKSQGGRQLPLMLYDRFRILTEPTGVEEVAQLISIPPAAQAVRQKACVAT